MDTAYNISYKIKITNDLERKLRIIRPGIKWRLKFRYERGIQHTHFTFRIFAEFGETEYLRPHGAWENIWIPEATNKLYSSVKLGH